MNELAFFRSNVSGFPLEALITTAVHRSADQISGRPNDRTRFFLNGEAVGFYKTDSPILYLLADGPRKLQLALDLTHKYIDKIFDNDVSFDPKKNFPLKAYGTARYARPRFNKEVPRSEKEKDMMRFMEAIGLLMASASEQYSLLLSIDTLYIPIRT